MAGGVHYLWSLFSTGLCIFADPQTYKISQVYDCQFKNSFYEATDKLGFTLATLFVVHMNNRSATKNQTNPVDRCSNLKHTLWPKRDWKKWMWVSILLIDIHMSMIIRVKDLVVVYPYQWWKALNMCQFSFKTERKPFLWRLWYRPVICW